ncbi:hypothetical protein Btru_057475 [Bulinus truncatus]|nr:hypothetical protein Btru_057475 [Bulinus truncatus]
MQAGIILAFSGVLGKGKKGITSCGDNITESGEWDFPMEPEGLVAPSKLCISATDLVFVVDASSSVGTVNFKKQLYFVAHTVSYFQVGPDYLRVGLASFSTEAVAWFNLKDYTDNATLLKAIKEVPYDDGGLAYTHRALRLVTNNMFKNDFGGRDNAPDIVIVITDGLSSQPFTTAAEARCLRAAGATVYAVGITSSVQDLELLLMASRPENVFKATDFDTVFNVSNELVFSICKDYGVTTLPEDSPGYSDNSTVTRYDDIITTSPLLSLLTTGQFSQTAREIGPTTKTPVSQTGPGLMGDVILLLDGSTSVGVDNWLQLTTFASDFVQNFTYGPNDVLFGSVLFGKRALTQFRLNTFTNLEEVSNALLSTTYPITSSRDTNQGLAEITHSNLFGSSSGGREEATDIVVLITSGVSRYPEETRFEASLLKYSGVYLVTVSIGMGPVYELTTLASSPDYALLADGFDGLQAIRDNLTEIGNCRP